MTLQYALKPSKLLCQTAAGQRWQTVEGLGRSRLSIDASVGEACGGTIPKSVDSVAVAPGSAVGLLSVIIGSLIDGQGCRVASDTDVAAVLFGCAVALDCQLVALDLLLQGGRLSLDVAAMSPPRPVRLVGGVRAPDGNTLLRLCCTRRRSRHGAAGPLGDASRR